MEQPARLTLATAAMVAAISLAVSLVASTAIGARAYRSRGGDQTRQGQSMSVKGSARQRITSDLAVWTISLTGEAAKLPEAYESLARGERGLTAYLERSGFAAPEMDLSAIAAKTHYGRDKDGRETREVASYELRRTLTVTTKAVGKAAHAAAGVTELLKEGVFVESSAPAYYCSGLPDIKISILGDASRDARARADEIARNAGCRVAEVRSVQMSPLQVVTPNSTEAAASGTYDTSTIEKDVTAVVSVTFVVAEAPSR